MRLWTSVTPGAAHAVRSAAAFSSHEETVPRSVTRLPSTSTCTCSASSWALRWNAWLIFFRRSRAAIVGVHAIKKKPWIVGEKIEIRDVMYLSISIDHRMNDGAVGARFMNHVVGLLQDARGKLLAEIL